MYVILGFSYLKLPVIRTKTTSFRYDNFLPLTALRHCRTYYYSTLFALKTRKKTSQEDNQRLCAHNSHEPFYKATSNQRCVTNIIKDYTTGPSVGVRQDSRMTFSTTRTNTTFATTTTNKATEPVPSTLRAATPSNG